MHAMRRSLVAAAVLLSAGCPGSLAVDGSAQDHLACVVGRVSDGDTFRCLDGTVVRLILIDTPEWNQGDYGRQAREVLLTMIRPGEEVGLELDVDRIDPYDRLLAYVHLDDGRMVNEELLRLGMAIVAVYPPNVRYLERFRAVMEEARRNNVGLWSVGGFDCTPADFRARRCSV